MAKRVWPAGRQAEPRPGQPLRRGPPPEPVPPPPPPDPAERAVGEAEGGPRPEGVAGEPPPRAGRSSISPRPRSSPSAAPGCRSARRSARSSTSRRRACSSARSCGRSTSSASTTEPDRVEDRRRCRRRRCRSRRPRRAWSPTSIVSKCVDHLPLYRQEKRYARQGIELSRSTLCGWLAEAAEVLDAALRLAEGAGARGEGRAHRRHADPGAGPDPRPLPHRPHLGLRLDGRRGLRRHRGPLPRRAAEVPSRDSAAILQCDAYAGYDELFAECARDRRRGGVLGARPAEVRRSGEDQPAARPRGGRPDPGTLRRRARGEGPRRRRPAPPSGRQKSKPLLDALKTWLDREHGPGVAEDPDRRGVHLR